MTSAMTGFTKTHTKAATAHARNMIRPSLGNRPKASSHGGVLST